MRCAMPSPSSEQGKPTSNPISIITPTSTDNASATASGPGVGGTSVCVIAAPLVMARM